MNADSVFDIGSTHAVCQDYVLARSGTGSGDVGPYVVLADGCSSSRDTDIGARLLVKAMDQALVRKEKRDVCELHAESARVALGWAELTSVAAEAVDATLLTAHVYGDELIVACSGDGVIVLESKTAVLDVYSISSPSGYPFYPAYVHQPERLAEMMGNRRCVKEFKHFGRESPEAPFELLEVTTSESLTGVFTLNVADYKYVAVTSDGLNSFFHTQESSSGKRLEPVCLTDVLGQLWSFKNSHGVFVERRLRKFKKDAAARSWAHADDLSLGVIHLGDAHVRQV
ncbi:MAG TPA: protein phosphatase 2C domain-containing protein [Pyrinomonadaceae bacterium]|nr:protein phosphatase 2C domain-containing protein [Pyrinomonadaceae bacterium]